MTNQIRFPFVYNFVAEGGLVLNITGSWAKGFISFVENPSFQYKSKTLEITKIGTIKKEKIESKKTYDIEIYVLKSQSLKRNIDGETKSDFFIVGDGSGLIWFRSKIELDVKKWYSITSIKAMQIDDEMMLTTSQYSLKTVLDRNDVSK